MTSLVNANYTVEFHSFHWDNFSPEILKAHSSVMHYLDIPIQYTQKNIPHGQWLDDVMKQAASDVVVIIEPDLISSAVISSTLLAIYLVSLFYFYFIPLMPTVWCCITSS